MIRERIFWEASGLISSGLVEKAGRLLALKARAGRGHAAHLARTHCILVMTLSKFGVVTTRSCRDVALASLSQDWHFMKPDLSQSHLYMGMEPKKCVCDKLALEAPDAMVYGPLAI